MAVPIERLDEYRWRIPPEAKPGMRVPAIIFADEKLMEHIRHDLSLEQAANSAMLPGIVKAAYAMPDIHQGYGLPIGAVVATDPETGVVTPGGVGYDINCGVRLLRTELTQDGGPAAAQGVGERCSSRRSRPGSGSHGKVRLTQRATRRSRSGRAPAGRWSRGWASRRTWTHTEASGLHRRGGSRTR